MELEETEIIPEPAERVKKFSGVESYNSVIRMGLGLQSGLYNVKVEAQNDWVTLTYFSEVKFVIATSEETGEFIPCSIDGNKVIFISEKVRDIVLYALGIKA